MKNDKNKNSNKSNSNKSSSQNAGNPSPNTTNLKVGGSNPTTTTTAKKLNRRGAIVQPVPGSERTGYLFAMSHAPRIEEGSHWFQMLPISFFTAVIIIFTRMVPYERDMTQFYWHTDATQFTDFFSLLKSQMILLTAVAALVYLLYRVITQSLSIVRSYAYLPMIGYAVLVTLSYAFSDYKEVALWGYNDRFEGTLVLLSYMVLLFFTINTVRTEQNIKWVVYPVAAFASLLGLLGLTQYIDHDFFRTTMGKKLITPSYFWNQLDNLNFTFQNREIYQTVYNINYVSFYLTLLIPLFAMLFIFEKALIKKIIWGAVFTLAIFNLIGSASSGGILGMGIVLILAIIVLNKRLLEWKKPLAVLIVLTIIVGGITFEKFAPELYSAINGVLGKQVLQIPGQEPAQPQAETETTPAVTKHKIDYIDTTGSSILVSIEGNLMTMNTFPEDPTSLQLLDNDGKSLQLVPTDVSPIYRIDDPRFNFCTVQPAKDDQGMNYFVLTTDQQAWPFALTEDGVLYRNGIGKLVDLDPTPAIGFKNNQMFGSGRGYIWSRSLPMVKQTLLIGHGADTYCLYFPHNDYVGRYNNDGNINVIVDKPHDMYLGISIGTGILSLISLIALWLVYLIDSIKIYFHEKYTSLSSFAGVGIFLGISGFLVSAIVNDSSVSVMPIFYGLLGTGLAINSILKRNRVHG